MVKEWVYRWAMLNAVVLLIDKHSSKGIGQPLMAVVPYDAESIAKPIFLTGAIRLFCGYIEGITTTRHEAVVRLAIFRRMNRLHCWDIVDLKQREA